jgi:hypothetical protein
MQSSAKREFRLLGSVKAARECEEGIDGLPPVPEAQTLAVEAPAR